MRPEPDRPHPPGLEDEATYAHAIARHAGHYIQPLGIKRLGQIGPRRAGGSGRMGVIHADDGQGRRYQSQCAHERDVLAVVEAEARGARFDIPHRDRRLDGAPSSDQETAALEGPIAPRVIGNRLPHDGRQNERSWHENRSG
jgi:hypothetical protein